MRTRQAVQAEFDITQTAPAVRGLSLAKVRILRDRFEADLLSQLTAWGAGHVKEALDTICRCAPQTSPAVAAFWESLDGLPPVLRKKLRTLRSLSLYVQALERRAVQRPRQLTFQIT